MVTIRTAAIDDHDGILAVVRDAFSDGGRDPREEVDIVTATWARRASIAGLELVAVDDTDNGALVGGPAILNGHFIHGVAGGGDLLAVERDRPLGDELLEFLYTLVERGRQTVPLRLHRHGEQHADGAEDVFDAYLPLLRYDAQPGVGLAVRKELLFRRGAIASPTARSVPYFQAVSMCR